MFKLGFGQVVALQRETIGVAVKGASGALERLNGGEFGGDGGIAGGDARADGLVIEGGAGDQGLQDLLVDPEGLCLRQGDGLAELGRDGIHLLAQGAGVVIGRDVTIADAGDRGDAGRRSW